MWCIPKKQSHHFVAGMERVLKVYRRPYGPAASGGVHGRDEQAARGGSPREVAGTPRVAGEVRRPLPPPGRMHGVDVRRAAIRLADGGAVTKRRTTLDWAKQVRALANLPRYRDAETITLVCDNLNTHSGDSFYAAFPAAEASRLNDCIHLVHTPKHGSWLNVAELEFSALHRQCLDHRIESRTLVTSETAAWAKERNREQTGLDWQLNVDDARTKLKHLYPKIKTS